MEIIFFMSEMFKQLLEWVKIDLSRSIKHFTALIMTCFIIKEPPAAFIGRIITRSIWDEDNNCSMNSKLTCLNYQTCLFTCWDVRELTFDMMFTFSEVCDSDYWHWVWVKDSVSDDQTRQCNWPNISHGRLNWTRRLGQWRIDWV